MYGEKYFGNLLKPGEIQISMVWKVSKKIWYAYEDLLYLFPDRTPL